MAKTYEDLVLEIGMELELTAAKGDFLTVLERTVTNLSYQGMVRWSLRQVDKKVVGNKIDLELNDLLEIDLSVQSVLGGRQVIPQDVVDLFDDTTSDRPRSIRLETNERGELIFRLAQRYIYDTETMERHRTISAIGSGRPVLGVNVQTAPPSDNQHS